MIPITSPGCEDRSIRSSACTSSGSDGTSIAPPSLEGASDAWEVRRALDTLPAAEREVVRLAHLDQLTQAEIAARLGIPIGTVKSRMHSAYRRLRAALSSTVEQV